MKKLINILYSILTLFSLGVYFFLYIDSYVNYVFLVLLFILLYLFYKRFNNNIVLEKWSKILLIIMSFLITLGYSYEALDNAYLFFGTIPNIIISLIRLMGFYHLLKIALYYIIKFYKSEFKYKKINIIEKFKLHPFLYSFIFLFIIYSVYLLFYYPGIINYDNANQIKEVLGFRTRYINSIIPVSSSSTLTNFNPIVHTILLGNFCKIGILLGNFNIGLFMYTLFQMCIVISIYSYTISFSVNSKLNPLYSFIVLLLLGFIPLFSFYSITAVKDTLYASFLLLFSLEVYYLDKKEIIVFRDYANLFLISMLVCLFRNNGIVVVIITLLFLFIKTKKYFITMLLILISFLSFNRVLLPTLNISGTSVREVLSIPFQQTARIVKLHPDNINLKDKRVISKILDYDNLSRNYNKEIADPVKNKFNKYSTKKDLKAYISVWIKGLFIYPTDYMDAWINTISGYFNPFVNSWKVYHKLNPKLALVGIDYHFNNLQIPRGFLFYLEIFIEATPVGIILNIAVLFWVSIIVFIMCIKKNNYIFLVPNIISILFCLISPINTYYRYIYPTLLLMLCMFPIIKSITEKNN